MMISLGLLLSGILNFVFPYVVLSQFTAIVIYGMSGFFLAMIYGPMTKVVSENTEPIHAVRCSLGYTFASFFGSPVAGLLATFLVWQSVFTVSSIMMMAMAIAVFTFFIIFEKKGAVKYNLFKPQKNQDKTFKVLIKHRFIKFCLISILTGIIRTCWVSWLPKYFANYLGYLTEQATATFSIATLIISLAAFIAIFLFEKLKRNMNMTLIICFVTAVIFFTLTIFIKEPIVNVVCMVVGIMASNGGATILWSVYCPSLKETGFVSGATGFLDFLSYLGAGTFSLLFGALVGVIGWTGVLVIVVAIVLIALIVSLYKPRVEIF